MDGTTYSLIYLGTGLLSDSLALRLGADAAVRHLALCLCGGLVHVTCFFFMSAFVIVLNMFEWARGYNALSNCFSATLGLPPEL